MEELNKYDIVTIRNIDNEDFSHPYEGAEYTIKKGEELPFPAFLGLHLAKHMAMKVCRKEYKGKTKSTEDRSQFTPQKIKETMNRIVVGKAGAVNKPILTRQQKLQKEVEELQKITGVDKTDTRTKKELMTELDELGIKYGTKDTADELRELLNQYSPDNTPLDEDQAV